MDDLNAIKASQRAQYIVRQREEEQEQHEQQQREEMQRELNIREHERRELLAHNEREVEKARQRAAALDDAIALQQASLAAFVEELCAATSGPPDHHRDSRNSRTIVDYSRTQNPVNLMVTNDREYLANGNRVPTLSVAEIAHSKALAVSTADFNAQSHEKLANDDQRNRNSQIATHTGGQYGTL